MSFEPTDRPAPDVALEASANQEVRLATTWADRPVALIFLRHFG